MSKISIGIDQSYTDTGFCICKNGKPYRWGSIKPPPSNSPSVKRKYIIGELYKIISESVSMTLSEPNKVIVIIERIRLFSQGFLSMSYIIKTAGLIAGIIDLCTDIGIKVYSVDTRNWKTEVVGTCKPLIREVEITRGKNKGKLKKVKDTKHYTVEYVNKELGIDEQNDNICDAICISMYPFICPKNNIKLQRET